YKLAQEQPPTVRLEVRMQSNSSSECNSKECDPRYTLGRQFLLLLPLGMAVAPNLEASLFNIAYSEFTLHGLTPDLSESSSRPLYTVTVKDLSIQTYDYVFTRMTISRVTLELHIQNRFTNQVTHERRTHYSTPFSREITFEFNHLIADAIGKLLKAPRP
ncbi:MAG: hypothetical protein KDD60_11085, partial [Bdellovibrionales bacterium]|nr:hypothetical protein [Bdellovibrionales bacterium]